jgi:hypothetical protein
MNGSLCPAKWYLKAKALEDAYKAAMMSMATMKNTRLFTSIACFGSSAGIV